MTHILLDIKYKKTEAILYDKTRGESIIRNWCEYNNHSLVMPPVSYVFPSYNDRETEKTIEGFYQPSLMNSDYGQNIYRNEFSENTQTLNKNYTGYTSIGMLKESHISIHTYPEHNCVQIDFFSCKDLNERENMKYIERVFKKTDALKYDCQFIKRNIWSD